MYDLFKYSPAYLPTFQKNAFWGQLSNLHDRVDRIVNNASNDWYLIGGTNDMMGMGRAGLMFDWWASVAPQTTRTWNVTTTYNGLAEYENIEYRDTDSDSVVDLRRETYGRSEETNNNSQSDIYAAYGLGGFMGMEVGAAIRGMWNSNVPSWDDYISSGTHATIHGNYDGSFDWIATDKQYDVTNPNNPILQYRSDAEGTGTLDYGSSSWALILGGRMPGFMPNMDLTANLKGIMASKSNKLDWKYEESYDNSPNDPNLYSDFSRTYKKVGIEEGYNYFPGTGIGVGADARLDWVIQPGINFTGWLGFGTVGIPIATGDSKNDSTTDMLARTTQFNGTENILVTDAVNSKTASTWEGSDSGTTILARARIVFPTDGFDFGLGASFCSEQSKLETTRVVDVTANRRHVEYETVADPTTDFTEATSSGYKIDSVSDVVINTIDLPVAFNFKFLKNFHVQVGVNHQITMKSITTNSTTKDRRLATTVRTTDANVVTTTGPGNTSFTEMSQTSRYDVTHDNQFSYGVTWWPYEQVRVDFTYLTYLTYLYLYRFSINLYY
ncbi:MAG: hypothetical protein AB1439_05420 [candidate division FCPU426 bacterium]